MKKEVLRINNLTVDKNISHFIENISLSLFEGEITSLVGLNDSGKDFLITLLSGSVRQPVKNIFISRRSLTDLIQIEPYVYSMSKATFAFENWTVSEFIGLVDYNSWRWTLNTHKFNADMENYLNSIGVKIDGKKQLKDLTGGERKILDIAKAIRLERPLIILQDEFEDFSSEELFRLKPIITKMIQNKAALLMNTQSNLALQILSDQLCLFKEGTIIRKFKNSGDALFNHLICDDINKKLPQDIYEKTKNLGFTKESSFILKYVTIDQNSRTFHLKKGEISLLIISDYPKRVTAFGSLSGRVFMSPITLETTDGCSQLLRYSDFIRNGIVSIKYDPAELLKKMSLSDNLLLPSISKLKSTQYILWSKRLKRLVINALNKHIKSPVSDLSFNEQLVIYYERWLIYKPKLLVLLDPFQQCDTNDVALVKDYIKKYLCIGTHVIVIQAHTEHLENSFA